MSSGAISPDENIQQLYQELMQAAGYVVFTSNKRGIFTHVSPSALQVTGFTPDELVGESFAKLVLPDWFEGVQSFYQQQRRDLQHDTKLVFPIETKDKETRWVEQTVIYLDEQADDIYQAIVRDITDQKTIELQLHANEQRFRGLFDHNNDAVFFLNLDGVISDVNHKAAEMTGYTRQDLIGKRPNEDLTPDPGVDSENEAIREALVKGENVSIYERVFVRSDGSQFPVEVNNTLVYDEQGYPSHIQSIVRDISERKEFEEQLAERIQQLTTLREVDAELADRLDVNYVLTMAVDSAMRLSGADIGVIGLMDDDGTLQQVKIVGAYPMAVIHENFEKKSGIVSRVIENMRAEFVPDVHADPDYVAINERTQAQISIPLISQERLVGILNLECNRSGVFTEGTFDLLQLVTARIAAAIDNAHLYRQSEEQLEQLRDLYAQVSKLEQLKTDMIRIASHDLRNPLSALTGFVELMNMDEDLKSDYPEMEDFIDNMSKAAKRMQKIINDILSLERIEEAANEADETVFNLVDMVEQVTNENENYASQKQQRVTFTLINEDGEIPTVKGHKAQMHEAVTNLINNAIKYTPDEGKVDIVLEVRGSRVRFHVKDTGYGIPEDQQENLFQPFYRAKSKETREIEGTGLGLHLVKKIIERHSGRMIFESVYGEGSTFGFTMPWVME